MKKIILISFLLMSGTFSFSQLVIQMKKEGGVSIVPCKVNGLNLSFIFDTGASDVTISLTEASFMLKNGYLKKEDIIGSEKYLDASGNISEGIVINLREIEIEGLKLQNVKASIVTNLNAPLLLGQSALSKLGTIKLDLDKNQLTIISASKSKITQIKTSDVLLNSNTYKKAFLLLAKNLTLSSWNFNEMSKYFSLNTVDDLQKEQLRLTNPSDMAGDLTKYHLFWGAPFDTYKALNASSYYFTFLDDENKKTNKEFNSKENSLLFQTLNNLKTFSQESGIDWTLLDTVNVIIKPYSYNEISFSFNCGSKQYCFVTTVTETFTDSIQTAKINLPYRIDSKSFFEFRNAVYNKFLTEIDNIKSLKNQNVELSYFYESLINNSENYYNELSLIDKQKFSSIYFEPAYWCERAANLKGEFLGDYRDETILEKMRLFTKGISLYEKNLYPFTKKTYDYAYLYSYRGECKYKMEDYEGAYKDYKKAIDIYEKNAGSRDFLKYSITDIYYDFSNICYFLKKYDECKFSIEKGINTYFEGIEHYHPTWFKLYTLKGHLNYFVYKNKQQACKDWSRAGELGDKDAYDFIKQYCNK